MASSEANGSSISSSFGVMRKHLRERDAFALAAAEMARKAMTEAGEPEPAEPHVGLRERARCARRR